MTAFLPVIRSQPRAHGWTLYLLSTPHEFPLSAEERAFLLRFFGVWFPRVRLDFPGQYLGALIQYNQLNLGNASRTLAENGKKWGVDWGLGYWPEREPPALWTVEEFMDLDIGEMPRPLMHQVFGVTAGDEAVQDAARQLLGIGPMILTLSEDPLPDVKSRATALFQPQITELALRSFPYYFPLLCTGTFAEEHAEKLPEWTCGISFFFRESPEEQGIFVASRHPLDEALRAAGAKQESPETWSWGPSEEARR